MRGDDGVEYGPVEQEELREWLLENRVGLGTAARLEGGEDWRRWQDFPELVALLAEVQATGRVLPPLPTALPPVLAPFSRRVVACVLDLLLAFILVLPPAIALYWMQPETLIIQQDASFLSQHPDIKVVIGGHCDDRGSEEYNIALGQSRAEAVKSALVTDGVPASRIRVISYGKDKPFCTTDDDECWHQNRRAHFKMDQ